MGRRTAEYAFSVVSVCSVVNALDAPRYRRGMTRDAESKKLVMPVLDTGIHV